jgi:hypothetical protein
MQKLSYNLSKYAKISKFERAKDILRNNSRIFLGRFFLMEQMQYKCSMGFRSNAHVR